MRILHVINSLGKGGAEQLLVASIKFLESKGVVNKLIYFDPKVEFKEEEVLFSKTCIQIDLGSKTLFRAAQVISGEIREFSPDIIHSHLYWPTLACRLAVKGNSVLFSTYHSLLYSKESPQFKWFLKWLDRLTYQKRYHTIYVSDIVKDLVSRSIGIRSNHYVLKNFVKPSFFSIKREPNNPPPYKFLTVANFKPEKNLLWLIKSFQATYNNEFHLDIYGDGPLIGVIKSLISKLKTNRIRIVTQVSDIHTIVGEYDAFITASLFEGFGIALAEAYVAGLPCIASDIPAHREVLAEKGIYFNSCLNDPDQLKYFIENYSNPADAERFEPEKYMKSLLKIYKDALGKQNCGKTL